ESGLASAPPFLLWPPLQNTRSLPDRYPDPRPVLDGVGKDFLRLAKIIAGMKQAIDSHAIPRPLLDLVEVADVRNQRVVGFFVYDALGRGTARARRSVPGGELDARPRNRALHYRWPSSATITHRCGCNIRVQRGATGVSPTCHVRHEQDNDCSHHRS